MGTIEILLRQIGKLFTWFIVVAPWEQALRVRCGKNVSLLREGIHWNIPFVDRTFRQCTRRRMTIIRPQTITTKDGKAITLMATFGYSITDLKTLYETLADAADTLEAEVASKLSQVVVTRDLADCSPTEIEKCVKDRLDVGRYGLSGGEFFITSFAVVKAYRFITGDLPAWNRSRYLNTSDTV